MKSLGRFVLPIGILFGTAVFAPITAHAQQPAATSSTEAQERFKRGVDLYEEQNFAAALVEFRRAYEIVPAYQVLYNVARSYYQLHDYTSALKTFDRYLAEGGAQIDVHRREEVEKEVALLRRRIVTVILTATKGSTVYVDAVAIGEVPLASPFQVNEGRRMLRATMAGRESVERSIEAAGGDSVPVDLTLREPATADSGPSTARTTGSGTPWWLWGVTGALAVGAGITGGLALGASSDASDIRKSGGTISDYDSAESKMRTLSLTTDILAVLAIGAGATALVLTLTSKPQKEAARARPFQFTF